MSDCISFGQITIVKHPKEKVENERHLASWATCASHWIRPIEAGREIFSSVVPSGCVTQSTCAIFSRGKTKMADEQVRVTLFKNCVNMSVNTVKSLITMTLWYSRAMGIMLAVWNYYNLMQSWQKHWINHRGNSRLYVDNWNMWYLTMCNQK